jgi:heme-degrading monooxygenase HmoA
MFYVLYRCRVKPGSEPAFRALWSAITVAIRDGRGGLGSRLHRGDDGLLYAYARWPSREAWTAAFAMPPVDADLSARMKAHVEEWLPAMPLEPIEDLIEDREP